MIPNSHRSMAVGTKGAGDKLSPLRSGKTSGVGGAAALTVLRYLLQYSSSPFISCRVIL